MSNMLNFMLKEVRWNEEKSLKLKRERGVSFHDIVAGKFLGIEKNPSRDQQWLMIFEVGCYAWVVPYVDGGDHFFLKTAFPSRKHTRVYLKGA